MMLVEAALFLVLIFGLGITASHCQMIRPGEKEHLATVNNLLRGTTGKSFMSYIGYGNYCGKGGRGIPVDLVDKCCLEHDLCYRELKWFRGCDVLTDNFILGTRPDTSELTCDAEPVPCRRETCKCDLAIVYCFARNDRTYSLRRIKPLRVLQSFDYFLSPRIIH